jgi:hypothetical protein
VVADGEQAHARRPLRDELRVAVVAERARGVEHVEQQLAGTRDDAQHEVAAVHAPGRPQQLLVEVQQAVHVAVCCCCCCC